MEDRSLAGGTRARRAIVVVAFALPLAIGACKRNAPAPTAPAPPTSAHAEPFVHPTMPSEPATPQARPECSYAALLPVAARMREAQKLGVRALEPTKKRRKNDPLPRCGTQAQVELDRQIKGELADRVRICVGQDGPLDPEWNLLEAALASLGECIDCTRMSEGREVDCQHTAQRIAQAESDAAKKPR